MYKIKINKWKSKLSTGKELEEDLLMALNVLIGSKDPAKMPRGIEKFRIFGKIANAFDKATETDILELESREFQFLKGIIETDVPSLWAMNADLSKAVTDFLEAKEE